MKIDFKHARGVFENYLNGYDRNDEKIKLKIIHTYGVVKSACEIGHRMHLNEEDQQLAELIALLHDIGEAPALVAEPAAYAVLTAVLRDHTRGRGFIDSGEGAGKKSIGPGGQGKCGQHGRKCQFSFKKHRRRRETQLFYENN